MVNRLRPWLLVMPSLVVYTALFIVPVLLAARLAFSDWNGFTEISSAPWVGFSNFSTVLADPAFQRAAINTGVFAVATTAGQTGIALLIAFYFWYYTPRFGVVLEGIILLPTVLSMVLVGLVWRQLLAGDGLVNALTGLDISWFADPNVVLITVIWMTVWQWTGWSIILFHAGLAGLPRNVISAARVDGANDWRILTLIAWPLLKRVTVLVVTLNLIGAVQAFDTIWITTRGGPLHASETLTTYAYWLTFDPGGPNSFGQAAAVALMSIVLLMVVSVVLLRKADAS